MYCVMTIDEDGDCKMYGPYDRFGSFKFVGEAVLDTKEPMEYLIYEMKQVWSEKYGQCATCP